MARARRIEQWRFNKTPRMWQSSPTTSRTCSNRCKTGGLEGFISSQVDLRLAQVSDHVGPDHLQNRRHGDKDRRSRAQHQRPHGTGFHNSQKRSTTDLTKVNIAGGSERRPASPGKQRPGRPQVILDLVFLIIQTKQTICIIQTEQTTFIIHTKPSVI